MRKLILLLTLILICSTASAQTYYAWRYRTHATDCTGLTGKVTDLCYEQDSGDLFKCVPSAGDCDTAAEWIRVQNTASAQIQAVYYTTDVSTGNGKSYFYVPARLNGFVLSAVHGQVIEAGTTGTTDVQIARCDAVTSGNACSGAANDMLSTVLTIDSGEDSSDTAASSAVIDSTYDDVSTNQVLRIDVDAVSSTAPKGLLVTLTFVEADL